MGNHQESTRNPSEIHPTSLELRPKTPEKIRELSPRQAMMAEMSVIRDGITSNSADLTECAEAPLELILRKKSNPNPKNPSEAPIFNKTFSWKLVRILGL